MNALPDSIPARGATASASRLPRIGQLLRQSFTAMTAQERARLVAMYGVIAGLHVAGFVILFAFVVPSHYKGLGVGVAVLAYTLGLRHAFDADHISAIDNCTRKVLDERQGTGAPRPLGFGFFFSLGHSTVVVAIGAGIVVAEKTVFGAVSDSGSGLERFGGLFGTVVSAAFLLLIGLLNLVVLAGIVRVFASMRRGEYDEAELERQLANRGFFYRFFGRWMKVITKEWQLYPVGVVFGLGFDTATEVGLLVLAGGAAAFNLPFYAILVLPILFAAGMCLLDTADGVLMLRAYGWASDRPVRKVFYNLTVTSLSVAVALLIGGIELVGALVNRAGITSGPLAAIAAIDLNDLGYLVVGLFLIAWLLAVAVWKFGRIEQRWS